METHNMQPTLAAPLLSRLSAMLDARIGLHFPTERWADLERGIACAAPAFGLADAQACAQHLLTTALSHREIEILASCLTVGETYFFRENRSFEVLEQNILPALLHARAGAERRLRIWSAGCCTGEEAYTIAMLLDRLLPNVATWNITLLATDINPAFLRKAAAAEYGAWSFRATPDWIKQRYFRPRPDGRFQLDERIRKRVSFSYLNLADDAYPSLTNNSNAMDIIFCRNVLMYFSAQRARAVVDNLRRALVDGGWLIVSPAETSNTLFSQFTLVEYPGVILYRKPADTQAPRFVSHVPSPAEHPEPWYKPEEIQSIQETPPEPLPTPNPSAHDNTPMRHDPPSRMARDLANQGHLAEAAEWCRKAIAADKLNPAHHYLLSTIQQEQGQPDDAAQSLTRALYLDPDFVLAHYALGNLRQSQGRRREARRHFDIALAVLAAHPSDEMLPEADGLSAGRLAEIIVSMHSSMPMHPTAM
jgi:chemotaxis protein methyltransferase CheR